MPMRWLLSVFEYCYFLSCCPFVLAEDPPFWGTVWVDPDIIQPTDPTTYQSLMYQNIAARMVFDRRDNFFSSKPMHLFHATYADGLSIEVQVNSTDFDYSAAESYASSYAEMVGRLPTSLRADVETMWIHGGGALPFGGGNNNILIHVDVEPGTVPYLEEILFHEAAHTSYGPEHDVAPAWQASQSADPTFISLYARDYPQSEDVAESLLMWYARRYRSERLDAPTLSAIDVAMPLRLQYFDALSFETGSPLSADFNGDFQVDVVDLSIWASNYGMSDGEKLLHGDADSDADVDGADFLAWQRQWGMHTAQLISVPEPSSPVLSLGLIYLLASRIGNIMRLSDLTWGQSGNADGYCFI